MRGNMVKEVVNKKRWGEEMPLHLKIRMTFTTCVVLAAQKFGYSFEIGYGCNDSTLNNSPPTLQHVITSV